MQITREQQSEIRRLISEDRKIEAIKYIRSEFGVTLRQAKRLADELDQDLDDAQFERIQEIRSTVAKGGSFFGGCIGSFFGIVGLGMLAGAIWIGVSNQELVNNGILVTATVVDDPYQPTFEYELYGQKYEYYSSTSTDPPAYSLGEKVEMYVNPTDAQDVLVNTFSDRWLGITILGFMGLIFSGVGFGVTFAMRRVFKRS